MDLQKWIAFHIFLSLHLCSITKAADKEDPNFEWHSCETDGTYTGGSTYGENLKTLLQSLSSNVNAYGFYNGSVGQDSERASAIVLCRGDIELNVCRNCVSDNVQRIIQLCPNKKEAFRWYNICSIYYSDESIIGSLLTTPIKAQNSTDDTQDPDQFKEDLTNMVDRLRTQAADGGPFLKYAADITSGPDSQTIYAYVQCTPDLSVQHCTDCLSNAFNEWNKSKGNAKIGARVLCPSCIFRYKTTPFFGPMIEVPPPPPPPPPSHRKVIRIVVSTAAGLIIIIICIFVLMQKRKAKSNADTVEESISSVEISPVESPPRLMQKRKAKSNAETVEKSIPGVEMIPVEPHLKYELITIQCATNNFSEANKVGEGGFGHVYKGKLENGLEVAVKRLSENSRQGNLEFKNEVALMAKLQHRNLVRLLGYCQEGREMILVYEFVPNGGLDDILFHPVKRGYLDWGRRYKIIESIARGLVYLHEDSRLRIIHRDLKASNILLDADLNPKIADFGMARLFTLDQAQGSTRTLVGAYGYMAPEYARYGKFSEKSDVYSFGVLVLEIISGQRNTIQNGESIKDLLFDAWTHWKSGSVSNVIDQILKGTSSPMHEIKRCIHVALLCVQENVADRPKMSLVLEMLSRNLSMSLPVPSDPGFFIHSSVNS